jgi:hypothetical protein
MSELIMICQYKTATYEHETLSLDLSGCSQSFNYLIIVTISTIQQHLANERF